MPVHHRFTAATNPSVPGVVAYNIHDLIDNTFVDGDVSPIDEFVSNAIEINKLFKPYSETNSQVLGNLIILGYVSAIESYFRALFRRLILTDEIAKRTCERKEVLFGAVISHNSSMVPEALFEGLSFAGKRNLFLGMKEFLGLNIQESELPSDLMDNLKRYSEICQLRHCIVHRFGKFGSSNAIALGLSEHILNIEKPIKCDFASLQKIAAICQNTVRLTNLFLFEKIMNRLIIDGKRKINDTIWTWDYISDKHLFNKYFTTFYCQLDPPSPTLTARKMYNSYRKHYKSLA